ncbi:DUF1294 domain-containing protein [Acinetobacter rudis]|uniref:DUF1294 domain-containing protein n=1 Tax=Acinetobacter rudis TaxID=632955 RepID=A0AAW8JEL4_9GAMM|nr:DUF1294 domain-containing protein [Acinetobacter rudis]MDQ8936099.1 DUF1294 domain-containing protein [Acinetobacter rudis]MDQ8952792.1 DUF1294 domain-containing protein [Acinetobacter rudis]MDQ9018362.1 DUF1294 domain-containing protein [Acinetobacter rudis]
MRDQGRLVEWHDEKGYGFIQPNDRNKARVFLHIKDFSKPGPRPIVGCGLDYQVTVDGQGRYRAIQAIYVKAAQMQNNVIDHTNVIKAQPLQLKSPMVILIVAYILMISLLSAIGLLPALLPMLLILINMICYWFYSQDKEAAQLGNRRVPEQTLHVLAFLGGWPAAWLAQQKLRHKTQKSSFLKIYRLTIIFHILLLMWLVSPLSAMLH